MLNIIAIHVWWSSQLPLNTVDRAISSFAEVYADQAERDNAAPLAAIKEGHVQALTEV
jgi:hypothetical protein